MGRVRRYPSRQRMDSPASCATNCAVPTADESNHSAVGTQHPHRRVVCKWLEMGHVGLDHAILGPRFWTTRFWDIFCHSLQWFASVKKCKILMCVCTHEVGRRVARRAFGRVGRRVVTVTTSFDGVCYGRWTCGGSDDHRGARSDVMRRCSVVATIAFDGVRYRAKIFDGLKM